MGAWRPGSAGPLSSRSYLLVVCGAQKGAVARPRAARPPSARPARHPAHQYTLQTQAPLPAVGLPCCPGPAQPQTPRPLQQAPA
jgi:hypothetical protein